MSDLPRAEAKRGPREIRDHYRDRDVAAGYVDQRFESPVGALLHDRQVLAVRDLLERSSARRVLEIAGGPARLTVDVASAVGGQGVLMDASAPMLGIARERLEVRGARWAYVQGDAFELPFGGPFDLVYSFRFIRHFEARDRARIYREIARVLAPGGYLVFDAVNETVSAPLRAEAPEEYPIYDALLRPETIRAELAGAGFASVRLGGVQHRYGLLTLIQNLVAPRSRKLGRWAVELVDRLGGGEPLEWIVRCRRA